MRLKPAQQWITSHNIFDWAVLALMIAVYPLQVLDAHRSGDTGWTPGWLLLFMTALAVLNVLQHVTEPD